MLKERNMRCRAVGGIWRPSSGGGIRLALSCHAHASRMWQRRRATRGKKANQGRSTCAPSSPGIWQRVNVMGKGTEQAQGLCWILGQIAMFCCSTLSWEYGHQNAVQAHPGIKPGSLNFPIKAGHHLTPGLCSAEAPTCMLLKWKVQKLEVKNKGFYRKIKADFTGWIKEQSSNAIEGSTSSCIRSPKST